MRSRYKRIVMQSSSESSAEHALVDALRIVFLRHRGRSWAQIKADHRDQQRHGTKGNGWLAQNPCCNRAPKCLIYRTPRGQILTAQNHPVVGSCPSFPLGNQGAESMSKAAPQKDM